MSNDKLYFLAEGICFKDLYDWGSRSKQAFHTVTVKRPGLLGRQNSRTGSLAEVNEAHIAMFRHNGHVYAIDEKCPHAGGPLHLGDIEDLSGQSLCVRCPWHSWRISLETGKVMKPSRQDKCAVVYPTKVTADGKIYVGFDGFAPKYFTECDL